MKALRVLLTASLVFLIAAKAARAVEFFPLSDIKVGMKGTGKTVVRGTKVESFNVKIIDIIPEGGFDGRQMILAEFSGPVIEASNGIAEGYSGSPVYIRDKLLGAISTAVPFSDTHVGGITPIENMLSALPRRHRPDYTGNTVIPEPKIDRKLRFMNSWEEAMRFNEEHAENGEMGAVPLVAPLMASGFSPGSLELLKEKADKYPFMHVTTGVPGGAATAGGALLHDPVTEGPLKAGDAVAISLMSGDIELSAIGTATYVDDAGQVLMFGHPLTMSGDIDMVLQKAYITYTQKSTYRAFKMGHSLYPVGSARQDRACAVGGLLNEAADVLPVHVTVNDIDLRRTEEFNVEVTRDPDGFDYLIMIALEEAFYRTTDTGKGGTLRLEFSLEGAGLKEPLHRVNYYYSETYPTSGSWDELLPLTSLLVNNIYRKVKLTQLDIHLDFTRNRVNAAIDDAELLLEGEEPRSATEGEDDVKSEVEPPGAGAEPQSDEPDGEDEGNGSQEPANHRVQEPPVPAAPEPPAEAEPPAPAVQPKTVHCGDALRVNVHLQPYRKEAIEQMIHFTLPEDFPEGPTSLTVHGGGSLLSIYNEFGGRGRILMGGGSFVNLPRELRDLDKIIEEALSTPLNNEIVVTILKPGVQPDSEQGGDSGDEDWEPEFQVSVPTEWVIYEQKIIPIIVAKAAEAEEGTAEDSLESETEEVAEVKG